jgi:hypothetical protein
MIYDAFLSYNHLDLEWAQHLSQELTEMGLKIFFDKKSFRTSNFISDLHQAIKESSSIIVLLGPSGLGAWQIQEIKYSIEESVNYGRAVIPVILPGVKEIAPGYSETNAQTIPVNLSGTKESQEILSLLSQFNWIDCRKSWDCFNVYDKLILNTLKRDLIKSISQTGEKFHFKITRPGNQQERIISIYPLHNPFKGKLLYLTWETFGKGIENLKYQIEDYGWHLDADAYFGINDAGFAIATFLNGSISERAMLGYIRTLNKGGKLTICPDSIFPELRETPTLILVDFEVKYSNNLKLIVEKLRETYLEPTIYFAVFGAMTKKEDLRITDFSDLVSSQNLLDLGIKDYFIAATMHSPGIEPPLNLR